jgi:hypothetical protein
MGFIGFCMALLPQKQFWIPFGLLFRFGRFGKMSAKEKVAS